MWTLPHEKSSNAERSDADARLYFVSPGKQRRIGTNGLRADDSENSYLLSETRRKLEYGKPIATIPLIISGWYLYLLGYQGACRFWAPSGRARKNANLARFETHSRHSICLYFFARFAGIGDGHSSSRLRRRKAVSSRSYPLQRPARNTVYRCSLGHRCLLRSAKYPHRICGSGGEEFDRHSHPRKAWC